MFKSSLAGLAASAVTMARNEKLNPLKMMGGLRDGQPSHGPGKSGFGGLLVAFLGGLADQLIQ
jgi:hypothetical protein